MARVVGVYALVMVGVFSLFGFSSIIWVGDSPILTFLHHERISPYDTSEEITLLTLDVDYNLFVGINIDNFDPFDYAWSPDGSMVAINVDYSGVNALMSVFDMDGSELVHLYTDDGHFTEPNWMPDNEQIVFVFHHNMDAAIYSASINEPDHWQLLLELPAFLVSELVVSPNGQQMFVSGGNGTDNDGYLVEVGNDTLMQIANIGYGISWSPDGQQVAFERFAETNSTTDLYVMNLADGSEQHLTDTPFWEIQPVWSPDGTQIAFVSDRDGDSEIYIMNADGSNVRQVTFNDVDDSQPAWVP